MFFSKKFVVRYSFIDFEQFYYDNSLSELLEKKVESLKAYRLQQTLEVKKRLGEMKPVLVGVGKSIKSAVYTNKGNATQLTHYTKNISFPTVFLLYLKSTQKVLIKCTKNTVALIKVCKN